MFLLYTFEEGYDILKIFGSNSKLVSRYACFMLIIKTSHRFSNIRSSPPEVFLGKAVLKTYSKFTGAHPRRSMISITLLCNFIKITLRLGCSPVNSLRIVRTPFYKNTYGWLLLKYE